MRRACVSVVVVMCACGEVSKSSTPDAASDGVDASTPIDAAIQIDSVSPRCNANSAFGSPAPISEINTAASEEFAHLSSDELTMYFSSTRSGAGGYDIFMATRSTRTEAWGDIVAVAGLNTANSERHPILTRDGLVLYAMIGELPNRDIGVATRSTITDAFTALEAATINTDQNDEAGTILPDHSAIWFSSNRTGNDELYRAPWTGVRFSDPVAISRANDPASNDADPVVTPDELTLFFASNRAGADFDVWTATRTRVENEFGAPVSLQAVNTGNLDVPTWVSADGCVLYTMQGTGSTGASPYDLFVSTRGM